MKAVLTVVALIATTMLPEVISQGALFTNGDAINIGKRLTRQTSADQMVQNILQWLQDVYTQNSRKIRQGTLREYLPPSNTQKPRPFESPSNGIQRPNHFDEENNIFGYPPSGSITPQPPFPVVTSPEINDRGYSTPPSESVPADHGSRINNYPPADKTPQPPFPTPKPEKYPVTPEEPVTYPGPSTYAYPSPGEQITTHLPSDVSIPEQPITYPQPVQSDYTTSSTPQPLITEGPIYSPSPFPNTPSTYSPSPFDRAQPTNAPLPFSTSPPTSPPSELSTYPPLIKVSSEQPPETYPPASSPSEPFPPVTKQPEPFPLATNPPVSYPPATSPSDIQTPMIYTTGTNAPERYPDNTQPSVFETSPPEVIPSSTYRPSETPTEETKLVEEPAYTSIPPRISEESYPTEGKYATTLQPPSEEDLKHPPHIHAIDVECAKDMMTINIEFNRQFDGVIYSKGFYNQAECRYVQENSGQTKYSFTVSLNSCGTEFINAFDTQGQSYLENILVLQNEPSIQEVWDTIRSVRCLWEGSLNKTLSVSLSVGMLSQEIVTFSGDTAMARLDIQLGRGPFAPTANGLVKIGEQMTLVVSVTGDPGFDIQVKDCRARDSSGNSEVALTDENGCVLKPKLFGAFQKTRNTENTGASIIAYAFFNAFKFPDIMDLMIECNIELCKTDCDVCPDPNQKLEPGRRRRRNIHTYNETYSIGEPVKIGKVLRVLLPSDLSNGEAIINIKDNDGICMSVEKFVISSVLLISLLTITTLFSAYMWMKKQHFSNKQ